MEAKFSNRVKEVISLSREEALRLGHDYIGTEHLLLGMIREGEGVAVGVGSDYVAKLVTGTDRFFPETADRIGAAKIETVINRHLVRPPEFLDPSGFDTGSVNRPAHDPTVFGP